MTHQELIPHLFRTEFSKITAVLCKRFGADNIEVAEDIASETFMLALETWTYSKIPENPTAWLYAVAKNKAKNYLTRQHIFADKVKPNITPSEVATEFSVDLSDQNIADSQLQMLFAICHPVIPVESQIGFALRILCGFGIDEIANAFLTNKETINKRLFRAREKLRIEKIPIAFPGEKEINNRIDAVLTTLYLLFNEGYYSESKEAVVQEELCQEAMRLCRLLIGSPQTNTPPVNALMALMCFHASRLKARKGGNGELVLYHNQDETLWNQELITSGAIYLKEASQGTWISKYHFEASIAYWHTIKQDTKEKWENILLLYNQLLQLEYSPIAALNRTYALAKVQGKETAIVEAEKLKLLDNHFYFMLLGELYKGIDNAQATSYLEQALALAKTSTDRHTIQRSIDFLR
ncbi:MAG: sigma factor [Imperialibacter sp.]|uniref:RNA polymerase sigma factor n=1 Tax=Imperialibacter sp. TaxID=2038411 RepID=UPI0032EB01C9